jgi:hypothetical protein
MERVLRVGSAARFDSLSGLVPCKVLLISESAPCATSSVKVWFKITKDYGCYRRGEEMQTSSLHVVPLGALHRRKYSTMIGHYSVVS